MKFVLSTSFSSVEHLTRLAPVADTHGWHSMSFSDHVVNPESISTPYPYTEDGNRRWQPFTDWPAAGQPRRCVMPFVLAE